MTKNFDRILEYLKAHIHKLGVVIVSGRSASAVSKIFIILIK